MTDNIKLATRKSPLALKQANIVKDYLLNNNIFKNIELVSMSTSGDTVDSKEFKKHGGKGLFLKELESALIKEKVDIAVHSMKDVPAKIDKRFVITSIMKREDPRDVFISNKFKALSEINTGTIGSSSPRRQAIVKHLFKGIKTTEIRGNINTRLNKLNEEKMDGIILAKAGLERMGMENVITESLGTDYFVPSPGQGILCIECVSKNTSLIKKIKKNADYNTEICGTAERIFAAQMDGDCLSPIGAYAEIKKGVLTITGYVASLDGKKFIKNKIAGRVDDYKKLAQELSSVFLTMGAKRMLKC